ncbi:GAF domain-containing protein [Fibrisoma montanum]|uniref:GAF domain-containing protein n=1 Tax=Fibrisoma montanum TaxID=2305895 RepID=A0A418M673_9BACT|nr:GAF domain-containing protein [Fibrisoma montanum]RIV21286.1 GAF domain-containing protein [Fibrisoma montanum]
MTTTSLPEAINRLLAEAQLPETTLHQVVEEVANALNADRCFLYVRQPDQHHGRIAFCWCRDETIPNVIQPDWQEDTTDLPEDDPLFRAAITLKPSVYVDDVETAGPDVLNREFEHKTFGHRALIHAHITWEGELWGILQPCLFGQPRHWTDDEKRQIEAILPKLQPVIEQFVR